MNQTVPAPSLFIRLLRCLMSKLAEVEIIGAEHLQTPAPQIIVANHIGWADPLWMSYAAYPVVVRQMAKKELFGHPVMGWLVRQGGGFPVDRNQASSASIKQAIAILQDGGTLLIFPEGTRNSGQAGVKRGAATIALHAQAELVPAHYEGPTTIQFRHLFQKPRVRVVFGTPLSVAPYEGMANKSAALSLTEQIDEAMKALM